MQGQPESQVDARQILMERIALYVQNQLIETGKSRALGIRVSNSLRREEFDPNEDAVISNSKKTKNEYPIEYDIVFQFKDIEDVAKSIKECEFYFRRYPFRGLPVSRARHIKNTCESYLSKFYELKGRIKEYLNKIQEMYPNVKIEIGDFVNRYSDEFDDEIRARNSFNHHYAFYDSSVEVISIADCVVENRLGPVSLKEANAIYRRETQKWVRIVRARSLVIDKYVDAIARLTLDTCEFLKKAD